MKLEYINLGKAVLDNSRNTVNLTILLNDSPYGTVQFLKNTAICEEEEIESYVSLHVVRSGGMYGDLKIYYR